MLKPDAQFKRITDISIEFLQKHNIEGLILDLDNTLIDYDGNLLDGVKEWIKKVKDAQIKIAIATNSINTEKVEGYAKTLGLVYVHKSFKPIKRGVKKAAKKLNLPPNRIAEIGDQLFTDVWVAKRMNMFSILTEPISTDRFKIDIIKRRLEKWVLSR